ncbi:hypothetical protein [Bradyrhizobium erythrophlei]|jgi:hypothetical protein|uniref:Uncharacterized protein n=1 Tax=Bradyrhizobium erythrophlei TaxID=1437360 RepID=A0A1M7UCC4_9BRAD|nr:hypothetical protein [Bradyrhizobium erythrophlei]SHN80701.1 hypothetical protein SAMN05444170_4476 [Bradyrhizobium erythrophlei]
MGKDLDLVGAMLAVALCAVLLVAGQQRIANFKAHQERFVRERGDFAASLLQKMRGQL